MATMAEIDRLREEVAIIRSDAQKCEADSRGLAEGCESCKNAVQRVADLRTKIERLLREWHSQGCKEIVVEVEKPPGDWCRWCGRLVPANAPAGLIDGHRAHVECCNERERYEKSRAQPISNPSWRLPLDRICTVLPYSHPATWPICKWCKNPIPPGDGRVVHNGYTLHVRCLNDAQGMTGGIPVKADDRVTKARSLIIQALDLLQGQ
jgi:hypothetical protein